MEAVSEFGLAGPTGAAVRQAAQAPETRPVESTLETQPSRERSRPSVFAQTAAVAELVASSAAALEEVTNTETPEPTDAEARGGVDVYA